MSSDPTARLIYGIDLGSSEQIDTDDLAWYVDEEGLSGSVERALLASVGFTETWETTDDQAGFHQRQREADHRLGVEIIWTGTWDYPGYVLAAGKNEVEWSDTLAITDWTPPEGADEKLARAVAALPGLDLGSAEPAWLLSAFYG
jgi:hypothetical protein